MNKSRTDGADVRMNGLESRQQLLCPEIAQGIVALEWGEVQCHLGQKQNLGKRSLLAGRRPELRAVEQLYFSCHPLGNAVYALWDNLTHDDYL